MDRDQTIALFSQGRNAWNAWAEERLAARKVLEEKGLWLPKRDWFGHNKIEYAEARLWMESAAADFSGVYFRGASEKAWDEPEGAECGKPPAEPNPLEQRPANFEGFVFPGDVRFDGATFLGTSAFDGATFWGDAWFKNVSFSGAAFFKSANFKGGAVFDRSRFRGDAWFRSASFTGHAWFDSVRFHRAASFYSVTAKHGFALIGACFKSKVPDFLSATFAEPVLFDNVRLESGVEPGGLFRSILGGLFLWLTGNLDHALGAKYRALKRLAAQSRDLENAAIFRLGELRARLYGVDKPWHTMFWFGLFLGVYFSFTRSILQPLIAWTLCIVIFAVYFLGQNQDMIAERKELHSNGLFGLVMDYSSVAQNAYSQKVPPGCFARTLPTGNAEKDNQNGFTGLVENVRTSTDIVKEALSLSYHNAFVVLDTSGSWTHRSFGCLYGLERYGGNPVVHVPRNVAIASGMQKILSSIFLFLFGRAVRNSLIMIGMRGNDDLAT